MEVNDEQLAATSAKVKKMRSLKSNIGHIVAGMAAGINRIRGRSRRSGGPEMLK